MSVKRGPKIPTVMHCQSCVQNGVQLAEMYYWSSPIQFAFVHGLLEACRFINPTSSYTIIIVSNKKNLNRSEAIKSSGKDG